jgi:Ca2+/Na+ antiporter
VIAGYRHVPAAVGWLALAAYTVVPACYMSFASLCHRGEHGCSDLTHAHRAIPALVVVLAGLIAFFVLRGIAAHVTLAVASTVAALWMFVQMRTGEDVAFAAAVELILLALVVFVEVTRHLARQRSRLLELAGEAGTASAGG